jgi:CRISPR-associated endonuclease/helicase Cas3
MRADERLRLPGLRAITLTATPMADTDTTDLHTITKADRAALGTRLTGTKVASLAEPASDSHADQVATLLDAVDEQLEAGVQTIACVVNSVRTAIDVEAGISKRQPDVARALLIGPQRPADRKRLLEEHRGRLFEREVGEMPFVCIATQTFEVGLDADVAGLVTQSASAVALVQRLGRLNRAGRDRGSAKIVRDTHSPLYEDDEPLAWEWLRSRELPDGTIDVSVAALLDDTTRPAPARSPTAADLTPEVVELLVQTAPRPDRMADPDVEVFLSGEERSADVSLCWRCDLRIDDDSQSGRTYRKALLRLAPPGREELVAVSIARAHMLLAALRAPRNQIAALSKVAIDEPDVDGGDQTDSPRDLLPAARDDGNAPQRLVLLRGRDQHEVALGGDTHAVDDLRLRDIRPGDVLVLPTSAGGYANGALAPGSRAAVEDVAADIRREDRDSPPLRAVRITEEALIASHLATHAPQGEPPSSELRRQAREEMRRLMSQARRIDAGHKSGLGEQRERLDAADQDPDLRRVTVDTDPFMSDLDDDADEILGLTSHGDDEDPDRHDHLLFADEQGIEAPAFVLVRPRARLQEVRSGDPPTLDEHARAVSNRARCYVKSSGLPTVVAASVVLAARAHDHGKADPRFQAFYRGGVPAYGQAALAKSVFGTADTQADRRARSAAGLPDGLRHEIGSVAALAGAITQGRVSDMPEEVDVELALHLVGTHHGLGRPIPRVPKFSARSAEPREFAAQAAGISATARGDAREGWDSGAWLRRFLITIERFGPWGTAYLEALLVLADRSVSGEGG